jgi:hypothetical protein
MRISECDISVGDIFSDKEGIYRVKKILKYNVILEVVEHKDFPVGMELPIREGLCLEEFLKVAKRTRGA